MVIYFAYSDTKSPCQVPLMDSHFWWMLQAKSSKQKLLDFSCQARGRDVLVSEHVDVTCTCMLCSVEHLLRSMTVQRKGCWM